MVPLRFVSEALGADVSWMAATQTVSITTSKPPTTTAKEVAPTPPPPPVVTTPSVLQRTVQSLAGQGDSRTLLLKTKETDQPQPLRLTPDAIVLSKAAGQQAAVVRIEQIQPGDEVNVRLDASGKVILLEATHGLQTGKVKIILGNNLLLTDGTLFTLSPQATFMDVAGKVVNPTDIKENFEISVRYSPQSKIAWQVRMAQPVAPEQPKVVVAAEVAQFFHNARKPLKEGDALEVTLVGTADCKASFDISNVVKGIPLAPSDKAPGRYAARYVVPANLNVTEASLFGRLEREGVQSPVVQAATSVTVDTTPPEILAIVPDEDSTIEILRPNIAVMYDARGGTPVAEKGVSLSVGGKDVTTASTLSPRLIAYSPATDMKPGIVRISVRICDVAGNVTTKTWEFTIRRTDNLIQSVQHSATGPLRAGDVLEVTAEAAAGGKAVFFCGGGRKGYAHESG